MKFTKRIVQQKLYLHNIHLQFLDINEGDEVVVEDRINLDGDHYLMVKKKTDKPNAEGLIINERRLS